MKTAEEFLEQSQEKYRANFSIIDCMKKFAKYHVEKALDLASKKSKVDLYVRKDSKGAKYKLIEDGEEYDLFGTVQMYKVNKESILNAYNLENIK